MSENILMILRQRKKCSVLLKIKNIYLLFSQFCVLTVFSTSKHDSLFL